MDNGNEIGKEREGELFGDCKNAYSSGGLVKLDELVRYFAGNSCEQRYLEKVLGAVTVINSNAKTKLFSMAVYTSLKELVQNGMKIAEKSQKAILEEYLPYEPRH